MIQNKWFNLHLEERWCSVWFLKTVPFHMAKLFLAANTVTVHCICSHCHKTGTPSLTLQPLSSAVNALCSQLCHIGWPGASGYCNTEWLCQAVVHQRHVLSLHTLYGAQSHGELRKKLSNAQKGAIIHCSDAWCLPIKFSLVSMYHTGSYRGL